MSILENREKELIKILFRYEMITLFCACFGFIYERFSHGVESSWMIYFFFIPLLGGVVPTVILLRSKQLHYPDGWSRLFYHSGIATLSVGCCLRGVFEIYGTSSDYNYWYFMIGSLLILIAIIRYVSSFFIHNE